ncbi:Hypothetical predicted protein [Paramuricea clavata]|uniref:Uncharacterized protein n=1 Tax=Paramuricea clavata TaxID=317549 RepID=A0A7D9IQB1_PARCT|nr:Hypothetical predicted protein [Paramuricea clavata]
MVLNMETGSGHDNLVEIIKKEEINLLKTEFSLLEEPSQSILSRLSEDDKEKLNFIKKLIAEESTCSKLCKTHHHKTKHNDSHDSHI